MIKSVDITGSAEVVASLRALGNDAPAALRIAITDIGEAGQRAMRVQLPSRFSLRGTSTLFERAIVFQAPKVRAKGNVEGVLRVGTDGPMGTKASATRRLGAILARHEDAETRTSNAVYRMGSAANRGQTFEGGFFVPARGLRTSSSNPPRSLYPTSIGAQMRRGDGRGMGPYFAKDKRKTRKAQGASVRGESFYVVPNVGIFRRRQSQFGSLRGASAMGDGDPIWWFKRRVRTPARLGLWMTAEDVFRRFGSDALARAVETVLRRGGGA